MAEDHIVCQSAMSACQQLIGDLTDEERKTILNSIADTLPENDLLFAASHIFELILGLRDPKLSDYMPRDFIEKAVITTHTLALNNYESNILYDLCKGISCSQFGIQHLPLDSYAFSVVSLILSSLFGTGAEEFHKSELGEKFLSWVDTNLPNQTPDRFIDQINKLLFPWDHVQYKISSEENNKSIELNIVGEYKSVLEHSEELGGIIETMVLSPAEKKIQLCQCSGVKEDAQESDIEEDFGEMGALDENVLFKVESSSTTDPVLQEEMEESPVIQIKKEKVEGKSPSKFACHGCSETFADKAAVKQHMMKIHNLQEDGQFMCVNCDSLFMTIEGLEKHELSHEYKCDECKKMFTKRMQLENHKKLHKPERTECHHCTTQFEDRAAMFRHMDDAHSKHKLFKCEFCKEEFQRMRNLRYHMSEVHKGEPISLSCMHCQKTFIMPENLKRHVDKVHQPQDKQQCEHCPKTFKNHLALLYHKKQVHSIDVGPLNKCPICEKVFGTKVAMLRHKAVHHAKEKVVLKCADCDKAFFKKRALSRHRENEHGEKVSHKCSACEQDFVSFYQLQKHNRMLHQDVKDFKCDQCPAEFIDKYALERHLNIHLGIKNFVCELCDKRFYTGRHLQRHILHVHEGKRTRIPRRLQCEMCEKTFGERRFLIRHQQREHLGQTDYDQHTCPICQQTFSGKSSLARHHRRIHKGIKDHSTKDFQCDICAKTFAFKQSLQRHMQSTHKMQIPEFECETCLKRFMNVFTLRKHQSSSCKPKKKRSKSYNGGITQLVQNVADVKEYQFMAPGDQQSEQQQFIEIQVLDENNQDLVQAYQAAASWGAVQQQQEQQQEEEHKEIVTFETGQNMDATAVSASTFLLDQGLTMEGVHAIEDNGENQEIVIESVGDQQQMSTNVVEVPVGVKYIQLGGKIVRLDGM